MKARIMAVLSSLSDSQFFIFYNANTFSNFFYQFDAFLLNKNIVN